MHTCVYGEQLLLQQPSPKKFKLSKIEITYKAKKFKVPRSLSKTIVQGGVITNYNVFRPHCKGLELKVTRLL